jgi:hypothetical protein
MALLSSQKDYYKLFSQHGAGENLVQLQPKIMALLFNIAYVDIFEKNLICASQAICALTPKGYYAISFSDMNALSDITEEAAYQYLEESGALLATSEFAMYLRKLCDLHRKRFKYHCILQTQPFATNEQIAPRSLLEYGICESQLLFNWMFWRKWMYDIDNRSAQETGYLFEPVLASCIGGTSLSHLASPVKRLDEQGRATEKGRQIDCFVKRGDVSYAYELKMRVSIAASGQGRFKEELSFPQEAAVAGIIPVLVVFDPTDSPLLKKLAEAYLKYHGEVYIGDCAWTHLKEQAGHIMTRFVEKYVEPPIRNMEQADIHVPQQIVLQATDDTIVISDGTQNKYEIQR